MLSQNGRNSIQIRWTPPPNPPTQGYQITTITNVLTRRRVMNPPFNLQSVSVGRTITVSVISLSLHYSSGILGPTTITVLGEKTSIFLVFYY